jgi:hypothetical protein
MPFISPTHSGSSPSSASSSALSYRSAFPAIRFRRTKCGRSSTRARRWPFWVLRCSRCVLDTLCSSTSSVSLTVLTVFPIQVTFGVRSPSSFPSKSFPTKSFSSQAAPLLLAPLSEVYGRNWIYLISAIVFALFFLPQALAQNIETILVSRFISGIAGSTAVSLVGGASFSRRLSGEESLIVDDFSACFLTQELWETFGAMRTEERRWLGLRGPHSHRAFSSLILTEKHSKLTLRRPSFFPPFHRQHRSRPCLLRLPLADQRLPLRQLGPLRRLLRFRHHLLFRP